MDENRAHSYPDLKAALLAKFDASSAVPVPGSSTRREPTTETYHRLNGLYRRWILPEQYTKEQIGEQVILEQQLRVFSTDIRTWVKEHEPMDGLAAGKLALQYLPGGEARLPTRVVPVVRFRRSPDQQPEPAGIHLENTGPHLASAAPVRNSSVFTASKQGTRLLWAPSEKQNLT